MAGVEWERNRAEAKKKAGSAHWSNRKYRDRQASPDRKWVFVWAWVCV